MTIYSLIWRHDDRAVKTDVITLNRYKIGMLPIFRAILSARKGDAFILNGALGFREFLFDLWVAVIIARFRRGIGIVISDATWYPRADASTSRAKYLYGVYSWIQKKLLIAANSPLTYYCFISMAEVDLFARETKIAPHRVIFTKFCTQIPKDIKDDLESIAGRPASEVYVFSGGNSSRDYKSLINAVAGSKIQVLIASSNKFDELPHNVSARWMTNRDYYISLAQSAIVVVPLHNNPARSAGQQTYLNAMALGKLTIVSDVVGVRDHLRPNTDALVVPPNDSNALQAAIEWATNPENFRATSEIRESGKYLASKLTFEDYLGRLETIARNISMQVQ